MLEDAASLIRFALPGAYAVLIGLFEEGVFGWAWATNVEELVSASPSGALSTFGGVVIIGFLVSAVYLVVDHLRPNGSADLGSSVLEDLKDIPGVEHALAYISGHGYGLDPLPQGIAPKRRAEINDERIDLIRTLLKMTSKTGDQEIARSYYNQVNWYHVCGACRVAVLLTVLATTIDVAVKHHHAFASNIGQSLVVSTTTLLLGFLAWIAFGTLRRRIQNSMTRQLSYDLRVWALQHPETWARLSHQEPQTDPDQTQQEPSLSELSAHRHHRTARA